ncbi:MAG: hypothetical protein KAU03_05560 [Candidatus Altiarchaeales archaeon]|nr:hypothetical protein [Candidatus Altiarchaeales archaeon]
MEAGGWLFRGCLVFVVVLFVGVVLAETDGWGLGRNFSAVVCNLICVVYVVVGLAATLVLVLAGFRYLTAEDSVGRIDARRHVVYGVVGLCVVLVAVPLVNCLVGGWGGAVNCWCVGGVVPSTTTTSTVPFPVTSTTVVSQCVIHSVNIGGVWYDCGVGEGLCPEDFNDGGCLPGSDIVCSPLDPDC